MNSKFSGSMGYQRLIKEIKRDSGGGPPGPNSVSSSTIVNGAVGEVDIADGAITEAKFHPTLQTNLATFSYNLYNLQYPGWYGNFKITNANLSSPYTFTFTVYFETFNDVTNSTDVVDSVGPLTLNHNQHYDLVLPIQSRLTNKDTVIKLDYTTSGGDITDTTRVGVGLEDLTEELIYLTVNSNYIHNGNIELTVDINT